MYFITIVKEIISTFGKVSIKTFASTEGGREFRQVITFNLIIMNVQRINRVHERYTRKRHVKH